MALRYIDSMGDHYDGPQMTRKWTTASFQNRETGLHGYGMSGVFSKGMLFPGNTIIMESHIYRHSIPTSLFYLSDHQQQAQIGCAYNNDGGVSVGRWAGPQIFLSPPDLIRTGIWYHFAWKVFIHPTAGSVVVRLNGETLCDLSGIPTCSQLYIDNPVLGGWSGTLGNFVLGDNGHACVFDDLVVMDEVDDGINDSRLPGSGGFNKFIGPVQIVVKRPNGVGTSAEWTPSPAVPNWQNVDDTDTADDDTTYNATTPAEVGDSDLFAMEDLLPAEDILAAQSLVLARKTEEGIAAAAVLVRDVGTTTVGTTVYQPNTYSYMHRIEPTLPGGALWSKTRWDAIEYGYRRMV